MARKTRPGFGRTLTKSFLEAAQPASVAAIREVLSQDPEMRQAQLENIRSAITERGIESGRQTRELTGRETARTREEKQAGELFPLQKRTAAAQAKIAEDTAAAGKINPYISKAAQILGQSPLAATWTDEQRSSAILNLADSLQNRASGKNVKTREDFIKEAQAQQARGGAGTGAGKGRGEKTVRMRGTDGKTYEVLERNVREAERRGGKRL